eukprot:TRINITY_DN17863_c0_g1_i1.p2 TRINITY_DN17863_c0_g1~~TRINITY_DN17863_c0_g1_i1.p2  ORF type:complete len:191 (+),score=77.10 TRINITY_DN17863_c0_g1_i1:54-626(+)
MDCEVSITDGMSMSEAMRALVYYAKLTSEDEAALAERAAQALRQKGVQSVKALKLCVERDEPAAVGALKAASAEHGRRLFVKLRYLLRRGSSNVRYAEWLEEKAVQSVRAADAKKQAALAEHLSCREAAAAKRQKARDAHDAHEKFRRTHPVVPVCATPKTPRTLQNRPAFDNTLWTPEVTVDDLYPYVL